MFVITMLVVLVVVGVVLAKYNKTVRTETARLNAAVAKVEVKEVEVKEVEVNEAFEVATAAFDRAEYEARVAEENRIYEIRYARVNLGNEESIMVHLRYAEECRAKVVAAMDAAIMDGRVRGCSVDLSGFRSHIEDHSNTIERLGNALKSL